MSGQPRKSRTTTVGVDEIHENTSTQIITITADKLKIILMEYLQKVEKAKAWQTPLGILLTVVLVFCSTDFKDALNIAAASWKAIFFIVGVMSFFWLAFSLWQIKSSVSIEDILNTIKNKT
ncbi:MAG TPA: hypothetical protein VGH80_09190 [Xanthomonadaceae bacterium]|jgi:hypothetical protein